ncbi:MULTISPECIES: tail assembly protein [Providencia]|uniref:tail assembly protein n=1 Tax=Providencia TaxID=586 RepID=UPI000F7664AB|nr:MULTISPECIES: tail assembly protein [Providencia]EJD6402218.1 tail assembly protein [Providencia rettgeri]MBV2190289.1 tail assembly protein [Providencia rettgeri]MDM9285587.1 tail assembly protein [Providencia rettgeri]QLQ66543.1 tail assembly protein [Providencia rettgeri]QPE16029.1 tail assembly protein [Providencia rettgeri]
MAKNDSLDLALPQLATIRLYGDLQRFGRRFDLNIKTAAEGLHALFLQIPNLKQQFREGWYQIRISGSDVKPNELHQRIYEPLTSNAVIHIVPRIEGAKSGGVFQFVAGAAILGLGWWGPAWISATAATMMMSAGAAMMLGGVAQMLTPLPKRASLSRSEEEKGNTYFSNLDNSVAQGMAVPIAYGEIMCGSRVISQSVEIMDDSEGKDIDVGKHGGSGET